MFRILKLMLICLCDSRANDEGRIDYYIGLITFPMLSIIFFCLGGSMIVFGRCFLVIGTGGWLNRVVMLANNGKMPTKGRTEKVAYVAINKNTNLRYLGDVIYFMGGFASIGDILQFGGIGACVYKLFELIL